MLAPAHTIVVIPCFNEAARLRPDAFLASVRARPTVSLLFVDDGSTDGTAAIVASMERDAPGRIQLHRLGRNHGKHEAVRAGLLRALGQSPAFVGYFDADLSTPLAALDDFAAVLEARPEVELVFGSRVHLLGWSIRRHAWRHYAGRVFATAVSVILGLGVYDTQCGAKLFRATPTLRGLLAAPFTTGWCFDAELLARLIVARRADGGPPPARCVLEVPLRAWADVPGSKVSPLDLPAVALALWRLRRLVRDGDRPGPRAP